MILITIISILFGHLISDFFLQNVESKNKTKKKKKNSKILLLKLIKHVLNYSLILTTTTALLQLFNVIEQKYSVSLFLFFIVTFITHFLTDFFAIKKIQKVLKKNNRNKYMNTIGFDQYIHYTELFITLYLLYIL